MKEKEREMEESKTNAEIEEVAMREALGELEKEYKE